VRPNSEEMCSHADDAQIDLRIRQVFFKNPVAGPASVAGGGVRGYFARLQASLQTSLGPFEITIPGRRLVLFL